MPVAIGLHLAVAIFFCVHAVRTGQQTFWLFILLSFPLLGSLIYFLTVYLPASRLQRGAVKLARTAAKSLDPTRELREAQAQYDYAPTAQNQIRLAEALLNAGQAQQALSYFDQCLQGIFADDLEIRWLAAQAAMQAGQAEAALRHLDHIRQHDSHFRRGAVLLLMAKAYTLQGRHDQARESFEACVQQTGDFISKAEYAVWAAEQGDWQVAYALKADLDESMRRWSRHQKDYHRDLIRRLSAAFAQAPRG